MQNVNCVDGACSFTPGAVEPATPATMSAAAFQRAVLDSKIPVVVEFHRADGCGRCRKVAPSVQELVDEHAGRTKLVMIDVDDNPALARKFGVGPLPHFVVFSGGKKVTEERPNLIPGEQRKRRFEDRQVDRIFRQALDRAK